jgi:hypothetical protein
MPHATRHILPGQIYRVTQRRHDRSFVFRFARDRDAYRAMLRERFGQNPYSDPTEKLPRACFKQDR